MTRPTSDAIRAAWHEFQTSGHILEGVRPQTARSWLRSKAFGVPVEGQPPLRFAGAAVGDNAFLRAARPVVQTLFEDMRGINAAMLLTDADARVIGRWSDDQAFCRRLDDRGAAVGFIYEESRVGTSALGSVLEEGQAIEVLGAEHYAENLQDVSAVGVPVLHPVTGRLEGVVDLVCPNEHYSPTMLPLVARAAAEIGTRLITGYAGEDRALLDAYLNAERRGPRRPMLAINGRVLMANPLAADLLGAVSHEMLWDTVQRSLSKGSSEAVVVADEDGLLVRATIVETRDGGERVGAVLQLREERTVTRKASSPAPAVRAVARLSAALPGESNAWQAVLRRASTVFSSRERILLAGGPGVGKRSLALALCSTHDPEGLVAEHDAADVASARGQSWLDEVMANRPRRLAARVVTHVDRLEPAVLDRMCRWLDGLPAEEPPVIATVSSDADGRVDPALLTQFPHLITLPDLSDRREDIRDIAAAVGVEPASHVPVRIEPGALRVLAAAEWPGNVRQLRRTVLAARAVCPGTVLRTADLPEQVRSSSAGISLTKLQRLERDSIEATLAAENGNKLAAAASLGISRSTLYRKMQAFGLDD
jgi:sigma-54 dependent transcriptional regulator, acetoin dehydrogenase operon transcriptional activator AcoR